MNRFISYVRSTDGALVIDNVALALRYSSNELPMAQSAAIVPSVGSLKSFATDATPTEIFIGSTASQRLTLANNSAFAFTLLITGAVTGGGDTSGWEIKGVIKRGANAASTVLVGSVTSTLLAQDAGASTWAVAVTADTTNGSLKLTVTGQAATTIKWAGTCDISEVKF